MTKQKTTSADLADALPSAKTLTSFESEDFLSQLMPKRFELLRLASKGRRSISDLATAAHRDQSAISINASIR